MADNFVRTHGNEKKNFDQMIELIGPELNLVGQMSVGLMSVSQWSIGQMSVSKKSIGQMSNG